MQLTSTFLAALMMLGAHQAAAAAVEGNGAAVEDAAHPVELIAISPYFACNCPDNCHRNEGASCEFHYGPSDHSSVVKGRCELVNGGKTCVPT